jgi:hypothetical protein
VMGVVTVMLDSRVSGDAYPRRTRYAPNRRNLRYGASLTGVTSV